MANSTAKLTLSLAYPSGLGQNPAPSVTINAPFQGAVTTIVDIPDSTAASTSFVVPFGSVTAATMVMISNTGNQDLNMYLDGSTDPVPLVAGGLLVLGGPTVGLASVTVETTDTQSGEGKVNCLVFGDPVVA